MDDTGKPVLDMKLLMLCSLLVFSFGASANWEVVERVDSMTDAKTVQAYSGDQRSAVGARPGAGFLIAFRNQGVSHRTLLGSLCTWNFSISLTPTKQ